MAVRNILRDPWLSDLAAMEQRMNELFGGLFAGRTTQWVPPLDAYSTDDEYVVMLDLPAVDEDRLDIEVVDQVLTVSGERSFDYAGEVERMERPAGQFVRSLSLPHGVDPDRIKADYTNGVLELRIPKPEEHKPKRIEIAKGNGSRQIEAS
ncbi:MAG: hypothetical protein Kow00129_16280 [Thermoleophilia bacterium]